MDGFERQFGKPVRSTGHGRAGKGLSLLRLFTTHVRTNGMRPTLVKAARVLQSDRFLGRLSFGRGPAPSDETALKLLALLQRDMDRKHAERLAHIEAIERALRDSPSPRDGG